MSDETTETPDAPGDTVVAVEAAPSDDTTTTPAPARRVRTTGGQTYTDRYLTPLLLPVVAVVVIIFYVLNLSRALLAGTDTISVVVGVIVTCSILFGAATLAAAPRMRSSSLALVLGIALAGLLFTGWVTVGNAQEEKAATATACAPVGSSYAVSAEASLKFSVKSLTVKAGCVKFDLGGAAGHTLAFRPPGPGGPILHSDSSGPQTFSWTLQPGSYTFYCTVDGHDAAGMHETITVK
jgi:plastocyanin